MPSVHLRGLFQAHTTATAVLEGVTLDLASESPGGPSWVGVVGPNGAGKTSLLRLVAGELIPTAGRIDVHSSVAPRLVPQGVEALTDDVRAFAVSWDGIAQRLRSRLALDPDDLDVTVGRGWSALSPGRRKRWQLAAALAEGPDLLLLDEPTNHLDAASRELVVGQLERFTGLGLVVSHDRTLLDRLTGRTLRLHRGGLELHAGAYGEASVRWRATEAAEREQHARASRKLERELGLLGDVRRDRHSAEVAPRRSRRLAGASQPDAREAGRKFAQRKAEAAIAQRVRQVNARVDRARSAIDGMELGRETGGELAFHHQATDRRLLAAVDGQVPNAGGATWLRDVTVALDRGEHVHVAGANGAGKTTLLHAVEAALTAADEPVATLPQELPDPAGELAALRALDPTDRGRVLGAVAQLGVDPDRLLVTDAPSPGEARKLALARLLVGDASVIVLDEPTNHLDLPSIERLQEALETWPGALLLVTHDEALAAVTTTTWHVRDHRVEVDRRDAP